MKKIDKKARETGVIHVETVTMNCSIPGLSRSREERYMDEESASHHVPQARLLEELADLLHRPERVAIDIRCEVLGITWRLEEAAPAGKWDDMEEMFDYCFCLFCRQFECILGYIPEVGFDVSCQESDKTVTAVMREWDEEDMIDAG